MPKVRKFSTGVAEQTSPKSISISAQNKVPDIPEEAVSSIAASAPIKVRAGRGNPRQRRYKQKTYSLLQEDIDLIERLVADIRRAGLYERGRSDVIRAGVHLLRSLPLEEQIKVVDAIESLKS